MNILRSFISFCLLSLLLGCSAPPRFSFRGGVLPESAKTISVQNFFLDVPAGPANIEVDFTERLRDYYQRNTRLAVVPDNGHLMIEGAIIGYAVTPVAPTSNNNADPNELFTEVAGQQRLTINIQVQYTNTVQDDKDFDKAFSQFADFDANASLSDVEAQLIDEIFEQIIQKIFNETVADW